MTAADTWVLVAGLVLVQAVLFVTLVRLVAQARIQRRQYEDLHMRSLAMRWHHELLEHRVRLLEGRARRLEQEAELKEWLP